jgi:hypothetical protein
MPTIDPLTVINIDGVPHVVGQMSDEVQAVIAIYNEWRQREVDARNDLLLVQSALRDLGQNLVNRVREEQAAAAEAAEAAEAATAKAAPEVTSVTEETVEDAPAVPEVTAVPGNGEAVVEDESDDSDS